MTKKRDEFITCPNCGASCLTIIFDSINVTLEPELKQKLIDWELFKFSCEICKHSVLLNYEVLYHDMINGLLLQYVPEKGNKDKAIEMFENVFSMAEESEDNFSAFSSDYYQVRVVSEMEAFVEKAQIYAAGFDNRLIEIMKYIIAPAEDEDINFNYDHIVFTEVGPENYQFMFIDDRRAVASVKFDKEFYEQLESDFTEKLKKSYIVDEDWAYNFLSKT
ncbi:TPA: CpXC domain-containing protein [Streptococcus suis]|nr:CpXC domain-containing protein [Streptococcus suis]